LRIPSSLIEHCSRGIDAQIIAQNALQVKHSDRIAELQEKIEQQHSEMIELMSVLHTDPASKATHQSEGLKFMTHDATEFISIMKTIESKLQNPLASLESVKLGLEEQKCSIDLMQLTLQALVADDKAIGVGSLTRSSESITLPWVVAGKMLATAASAFAGGYAAVRTRAFGTASESSAQAVKQLPPNVPYLQRSDSTHSVAATTTPQRIPRSYLADESSSWPKEFLQKPYIDLTSQQPYIEVISQKPDVEMSPGRLQTPRTLSHHHIKQSHGSSASADVGDWCCESCGDGPIPGWIPECSSCGKHKL
jgi:hypothetical protein